jgi:hypothetical protein
MTPPSLYHSICFLFFILLPLACYLQPAQQGTGLILEDEKEMVVGSQKRTLNSLTKKEQKKELTRNGSSKELESFRFPTPADQGKSETCGGHCLIYNAMSYYLNKGERPTKVLNPFFTWWLSGKSCEKGYKLTSLFDYVIKQPIPQNDHLEHLQCDDQMRGETEMRQVMSHKPTNLKRSDISDVASPSDFDSHWIGTLLNIKTVIDKDEPLLLAFNAPDAFKEAANFKNGIWLPQNVHSLNRSPHAMLIVGYDHYKLKGNPNYRPQNIDLLKSKLGEVAEILQYGAVKVLNSWGNWSNNQNEPGYVWIPYVYLRDYGKFLFEIGENKGKKDIQFTSSIPGEKQLYSEEEMTVDGQLAAHKMYLVTIIDETIENDNKLLGKKKRAEGRVNDRENLEYEFKKISNAIGYELVYRRFSKDDFTTNKVKDYLRTLRRENNPDKLTPDDIFIVYFRGKGTGFYDQKGKAKVHADMVVNDGKINCLSIIKQDLLKSDAYLKLLITDFSDKYKSPFFTSKAYRENFKTELVASQRATAYYQELFRKERGTYWITSNTWRRNSRLRIGNKIAIGKRHKRMKNYSIAGVGSYFTISLGKALEEAENLEVLEDKLINENQDIVQDDFIGLPLPDVLQFDPTSFSEEEHSRSDTPSDSGREYLPHNYKEQALSLLNTLFNLEPALNGVTGYEERNKRIAEIKTQVRPNITGDAQVLVQENEAVYTEFGFDEYLEKLNLGAIASIEVLDYQLNENGQIDAIAIKENIPGLGLPLVNHDLAAGDVEKGVALRLMKQAHHFYSHVEAIIHVTSSAAFIDWNSKEALQLFVDKNVQFPECQSWNCGEGPKKCLFPIHRYIYSILPKSDKTYQGKLSIIHQRSKAELDKFFMEGNTLRTELTITQKYNDHENEKKFLFQAQLSEDNDGSAVINNLKITHVSANCNN